MKLDPEEIIIIFCGCYFHCIVFAVNEIDAVMGRREMVLEWVDRVPMMINAEHCDPHPSFFLSFFFK